MANQPKKYKKFVATAATATLVASAIVPVASAATPSFSDIGGNDHEAAIQAVAALGYINGYTDGTFKPGKAVTRGQVALILGKWAQAQGVEVPSDYATKEYFNDLPASATDENKQMYALVKAAGIFEGSNGSLNPGEEISRQHMAVVLNGAYKAITGKSLVEEAGDTSNVTVGDINKVSADYRDEVKALKALGITAPANFNPTGKVTRGQFASFLNATIAVQDGQNLTGITSIVALDDTNKFLQINFGQAVSELDPSDITIKDAKTGDVFGVQEVKLASNGKSAQLTLFENRENTDVLKENTEYTVTVNVDGKILTGSFYDAAFTESRVVDINVADKEFTIVDEKDNTSLTVEVPENVKFDYEAAFGEKVRVWYNDDRELVKYEIIEKSAIYGGIEIKDNDEITFVSEDKDYDLSDDVYKDVAGQPSKVKYYVNGAPAAAGELAANGEFANAIGKKFNYAKVGLNKSGDVEYISAYNLNNFLVVDKVEGDEIVGVDGDSGGAFDAEDATIIKDGKVITLADVKKGDVVFFSDSADGNDGFAVVYNNSVSGKIEAVYSDSIKVDGKVYDFTYDSTETNAFGLNYGYAVYLDKDELAQIDTDAAEDLQAGGDVTLYLDPAGNLVYVAGEAGEAANNEFSAVLTDNVSYDTSFGKDKVQVEALLEDGKEVLEDITVENLDTITINGKSYDIDNDDTSSTNDKYVLDITGGANNATDGVVKIYKNVNATTGAFENPVDYGTEIDLDAVKGALVKLHVNDNGVVEEVELFNSGTTTEGTVGLNTSEVLEAGDTYFKSTQGSKKLNNSTVVYDVTDGYDADDITITTWGEYKGSDIDGATAIYNDDNEVIAFAITSTTTSDTTLEEAVITNVLRNKDSEIVEISAYVNGQEKTFAVDEFTRTLAKGDVAVLEFDDNNADLVKGITTATEGSTTAPTSEYTNRVTTGLVVSSVDVGKKEVTFTNGDTYKLVNSGAVLNGTDNNDISVKGLADLRGKTNVTVVLDENSGTFAKYFVYESNVTADTTAPAAHGTTPITNADVNTTDAATTYAEDDTITISFSEPVKVNGLELADLVLSANSFGTGATLEAVSPSNGFATSFKITLGTGTTVLANDTITINKDEVSDVQGNKATANVVFTLPAAQ